MTTRITVTVDDGQTHGVRVVGAHTKVGEDGMATAEMDEPFVLAPGETREFWVYKGRSFAFHEEGDAG